MNLGCQACLRHHLRVLNILPGRASTAALRRYAVPSVPPSVWINEGEERNPYGLRNKIEHLLRMQNPEAAEKTLGHAKMDGSEYSWNLLIKYYSKLGKYAESERIYQLVFLCTPKTNNR
jgi:pentatricopeptide repeat protein